MINFYKKSITSLLALIHKNSENPFENINIWYDIQIVLIKKITYIENKIRNLNNDNKELNFYRKNPKNKLSKEKSIEVKNKIQSNKNKLEEYRFLIKIYNSIGDAIAFTFIHKLDIKPLNFKQSAGFISKKSGFKKEKLYFKLAFENGYIAILNDLTSVLKYCDITLISNEGYKFIEIKSSNTRNPRVERQEFNSEKIFKYLTEDITTDLYNQKGIMKRVSLVSEELNYIEHINELIEESKLKKNSSKKVENGVLYLVSREFDQKEMDKIFKDSNFSIPMMFSLNQMKFIDQGYYPFSLIFKNPNDYFEFLRGDYVIMIFIDLQNIIDISQKFNFKMIETNDDDFIFEFENLNVNPNIKSFKMSYHIFLRSVFEFVSVEWLLQDTFERFINIDSNNFDLD